MRPFFSIEYTWSKTFSAVISALMICLCLIDTKANAQSNGGDGRGGGCFLDSVVFRQPSCNGVCDGEVILYVDFPLPLQYSWNELPGVITPSITGVCPGTYHFTATDSNSCFISDSIVIIDPPPVSFSIMSQGTSCPGGCTGSLTVVPADTLPYSFYWPGYMATGPVLGTLCQGTYNVIVTDANGCSRIETADVSYIPPFQLNFFSAPASCLSSCNGTAAVVANGTPPFHYQWGTGPMQNTQQAFGLCVGSYIVNVTDSIGCTVSDSVYIDYQAPVLMSISFEIPTCFGGCDGTAGVMVAPAGNYSYVWNTSPPQFSSTATGLCSGIYSVAVTDLQSGCQYFETVEIDNPVSPSFSFSVTPAYCNNSCSGTVSVSVNSTAPISYLWSNGCISQSDSSLCPGVYTVTVTDSLGCSSEGSVAIGAETLALYSGNTTCNNICDGTAGIVLPFPSEWFIDWVTTPVQHTETISGLCEGSYDVAIVDSSGCQLNGTVYVQSSQQIFTVPMIDDVSCIGVCDGEINLIVTGNGPFQIEWNTLPVQSGPIVSGLCAGTVSVTIFDSLGCSRTDSIIIADPDPTLINYFTVPNSCSQICDAVIEAIPAGATSVTYQWQTIPPQNASVATGLCPGWVYVTITDSSGCSKTDSVMVIDTPPLDINLDVTDVSCTFLCDGFISCQASGGQPGFTYQWSNGFQTPQVLNLCAGTYSVTVTDVAGCTGVSSVILVDPTPLNVSIDVLPALCLTCTEGSIEATVTGGTPPYLYIWNPGGFGGPMLDSLTPGVYNLCVVDDNSCSYCEDIFVADYTGLQEATSGSGNVTVMPNPFSSETVIKVTGYSGTFKPGYYFSVTDVNGKTINTIEMKFNGQSEDKLFFEINNHEVPDGIYFFRITESENNYFSGKFVIFTREN